MFKSLQFPRNCKMHCRSAALCSTDCNPSMGLIWVRVCWPSLFLAPHGRVSQTYYWPTPRHLLWRQKVTDSVPNTDLTP
ncbi:hypothetical protein EBB79_07105 [Parasedimentitalea marina]|uniref:Uncharacterized protein n=1 Tax=Parasedimentitalea marina TaxID=2483033 RepID=A0A3T0N107_9RHOB|nr:hypothetical protein EBB79_07105 [Parasedimentitalea marina]